MKRLLVINPGSTSTKFAVYEDGRECFSRQIAHETADLARFASTYDQTGYRRELIVSALAEADIPLSSLAAVIGRGGPLRPLPGGVYRIDEAMVDDLLSCRYGEHASAMGCLIAYELGRQLDIPALTADPVVVDELEPLARISGYPDIERISVFHALNQKAVARRFAAEHDLEYEAINLIVAHIGGGVSVGAHEKGRVVDVANALDGEGPFSAERSGSLPISALIRLCYSGRFQTADDLLHTLVGRAGLYGYLGTKDGRVISARIDDGDDYARLIYEAMAYQIAKEIASLGAVLRGDVDAILLTGGLAHDRRIVDWISSRVAYLADVHVYAGEGEAQALAESALAALNGERAILEYAP